MIHFYLLFILLGLNFPGALLKKHKPSNSDSTANAEADISQQLKPSIIEQMEQNLINKHQNELQIAINELIHKLRTEDQCCDNEMLKRICIHSKYFSSNNIEISQNAAENIMICKSAIYEKDLSPEQMPTLKTIMKCLDILFPVVDMFDAKVAEMMFIPPPGNSLSTPQNTPALGNSMLESATAQDAPQLDSVVKYITPLDTPAKEDSIVENVDPQDSPPKEESIAENNDPQVSPSEVSIAENVDHQDASLKRDSVFENIDLQDKPANMDSFVENVDLQDMPANMDSIVENVEPQDTPLKGDYIAENVDPV